MRYTVRPATRPLRATLAVPGDKSISHRSVLFSAMAQGTSNVTGALDSEDVRSSIDAVRALGASVETTTLSAGSLRLAVTGWGSDGPSAPSSPIDAGNSGTTTRLLLGILAGWPGLEVRMVGDRSLSSRPMRRVIEPLTRMGASFDSDDGRLPITVHGATVSPGTFKLPMASAQVKTAILLAGLSATGTTEVFEPSLSRNHTELMLPAYGVNVQVKQAKFACRVKGPALLSAADLSVPGDPSSAAFWAVAAAIVPGSDITVTGVSLNPTRTGFLRVLEGMGATTEVVVTAMYGHEAVGSIRVLASRLGPARIVAADVPSLVDELPILALAAARADGISRFEGVGELRVKESDRLAAIADGLTALGVKVRDGNDWLEIHGNGGAPLASAELDSLSDHRLAMSRAIAGLVSDGPVVVERFEAVSVSYPRFPGDLDIVTGTPPEAC